jgi:paired amphipathic helix protein Sin3a
MNADGYEDTELRKPPLARELQYFERVKRQLRSRESYADLLKCIHLFNQDIISRGELVGLVNDIIGKNQELMVRPGPTLFFFFNLTQ